MLGALSAGAQPSPDDSKLLVTVTDQYGAPIADLKTGSFTLMEKMERPVTSATYNNKDVPDVVLLVEGSAFTKSIRNDIERMAILVISEMGPQERMSLIRFSDSAELMQDFTSSKQALVSAVKGMGYENAVSLADAT